MKKLNYLPPCLCLQPLFCYSSLLVDSDTSFTSDDPEDFVVIEKEW